MKSHLFSNTTFQNITKVFVYNFGARLVNVLYIVIIIKKLSIADYALFTNFLAIGGLISSSIFTGFNSVLTQYLAKTNKSSKESINYQNSLFIAQILLYSLILITVIVGGESLSEFLFKTKIYYPTLVLGTITAIGIILTNFVLSIYQGNENFKWFNYFNAGRPLFVLIPILFFYFNSLLNFETAALAYLGGNIIFGFILFYIAFRKRTNTLRNYDISLRPIIKLILDLKYLLIYFIILGLVQQLDILLLSRFANSYEISNYGVALRYFSMLVLLIGSISVVLLPLMAKKEKSSHRAFIIEWSKKTVWLFLLLPLYPFLKGLFLFVNGTSYNYSFQILFILVITFILGIILSPSINILITNRNYKQLSLLAIIALFICFIGNLFILKYTAYGAMGVAYITLLTNLAINFGSFLFIVFSKTKGDESI